MEHVTTVAPAPITASVPSGQTARWDIRLSKDLWFYFWTAFLPFQIFFFYKHPILRWQDCGARPRPHPTVAPTAAPTTAPTTGKNPYQPFLRPL